MYGVQLVNITKKFKDNHQQEITAVDNLNLQIYEGEFFSLLGSSGCGKTTTLRMIAGFELPTQGEILIHNKSMGNSPPFHRPVNTVFQNYALFPHLNMEKNIAFGLEMEGLSPTEICSRVGEVLAMVKLNGLEKRYPKQLSGGQQQRVALARSLVKKPEVLLLDEPLGALDLKLRQEMQLELKKLQQQVGITFIYVTHDQEEALTMSDRLAVMDSGKILQVGTPQEIYEQPNSLLVANFIGESNILPATVKEIENKNVVILIAETLPLRLNNTHNLALNQKINLVIRPEKISLTDPNHLEQSPWNGTIKDLVYLGTDTKYIVSLGNKINLTIRQQNLYHTQGVNYQIGSRVKVNLSPHNIHVIF
jgi:spermidine/putrescine transport system ATP-binding protein